MRRILAAALISIALAGCVAPRSILQPQPLPTPGPIGASDGLISKP